MNNHELLAEDLAKLAEGLKLNISTNIIDEADRIETIKLVITNIAAKIKNQLEFESLKNKTIDAICILVPVAAILIPGGLIADLLMSGGLVAIAQKFEDHQQEISLADLVKQIDKLIAWADYLEEIAKTLSSDANFLNILEQNANKLSLSKQFSKIKTELTITLNLEDINILNTQIKTLIELQKEVKIIENIVIQTNKNLDDITNQDNINEILTALIPYFGNSVFALKWIDKKDGLIISYGKNTKKLAEIIDDCLKLEENVSLTIEKLNSLLIQAEQYLKNHKNKNQLSNWPKIKLTMKTKP